MLQWPGNWVYKQIFRHFLSQSPLSFWSAPRSAGSGDEDDVPGSNPVVKTDVISLRSLQIQLHHSLQK